MMARCVCPSCCKVFVSVKGFNRHRTGKYSLETRRCMTEQEMTERGMSLNAHGQWITEVNKRVKK